MAGPAALASAAAAARAAATRAASAAEAASTASYFAARTAVAASVTTLAAARGLATAMGFATACRSTAAGGLTTAAGGLTTTVRRTTAGWRASFRRPGTGSPVSRSGAANGTATVWLAAAGIALDGAWAVDGSAVAGVAGWPAGPAARIGPRPLPGRGLVGWWRMRRSDMDRRRLGRRRRMWRGLDHGRTHRRVGQVNRR